MIWLERPTQDPTKSSSAPLIAWPRDGIACIVLAISLLLAQVAWAEVDAPLAETSAAAISTARIADQAERAIRSIRAIEKTTARSILTAKIEGQLPKTSTQINLVERVTAEAMPRASLEGLSALLAEWEALTGNLPEWRRDLTTRASAVGESLETLDSMDAVWSVTREKARSDGAPQAILERINEVTRRIEEARVSANERRSALLTMQSDVAAQENRIAIGIANLEDMRESLVSRIFERDELPVWAPEVRSRLFDGLQNRVLAEFERKKEEFLDFVRAESDLVLFHGLLFAALTLLLLFAQKRVRRRTEEEAGLAGVAEVFEAPVSTALLLAILATPWIYPQLPPVAAQVAGAAALVPTIVLLRRFIAHPLIPLLNALIVFYCLDRLRELAVGLPTVSRSLFLVEMLGGIIFLGWLLRPARLAELPAGADRAPILRVLGSAGRVALFLFAGAFIAEALGFSRLGTLVGSALLESAYVGVVAYAAVRVLDSLVTLALRVRPLGLLRMVQRSRYLMRLRIRHVLRTLAFLVWAVTTLELVALRRPLVQTVEEILYFNIEVGSVSFTIGGIAAFVFTIWFSFQLSRFVRFVLSEDIFPRLQVARGIPYAISAFSHYVIVLLGFFIAIAAMGIDMDRFALLAGALGVGIGFGLQNVVNNFISGLILLSERPVQVGDTIEAGGALGEIKRIGIRSSTVRTWTGAELIVPNSELISERVTNWTLSDRQRRVDVPVGVAYGTDRNRVIDVLSEAVQDCPGILEQPAPAVLFRGFGDSSLDFEVRAWTDDLTGIARVQSDMAMAIGQAIDQAGIEIPFPQRDLHIRSISPGLLGQPEQITPPRNEAHDGAQGELRLEAPGGPHLDEAQEEEEEGG